MAEDGTLMVWRAGDSLELLSNHFNIAAWIDEIEEMHFKLINYHWCYHREDGPAIKRLDGKLYYCLEDEYYPEEMYRAEMRARKLKSFKRN